MQADKMDNKFPIFASFVRSTAPVISLVFNNMIKWSSNQNGCPLMQRLSQCKPPALTHLTQFIIHNYSTTQSYVVEEALLSGSGTIRYFSVLSNWSCPVKLLVSLWMVPSLKLGQDILIFYSCGFLQLLQKCVVFSASCKVIAVSLDIFL